MKAKPELRDASHLDTAAQQLPAGRAGLSLPSEEQEVKPRGEPTSPASPWAARPNPTIVWGRWRGEQLQNHPAAASLRTSGQRSGAGAMASLGFGTHRLPRGVCLAPVGSFKSLASLSSLWKESLINGGWECCRRSLGAGQWGWAPAVAPCHRRLGGPFLGGD